MPQFLLLLFLMIALVLPWGGFTEAQTGAGEQRDQAVGTSADVPVSADWLVRAQRDIAAREYRASPSAQGLQAPNRAHNIRTTFGPTGIRVQDRTAAGSPDLLRLTLAGIGRGGALVAAEPGIVSSDGTRVEIRRGTLVEWYHNSEEGLEQGFTLEERPAGSGPLVLDLVVEGARASRRGDALVLATAAGRKLRYGELHAWDAAGESLVARLDVTAAGDVRLEVEDAEASYPLVIDPLLTATWDTQLESGQGNALLGYSVAGAGDVNGDGYTDVIVGAPQYDTGTAYAGAAFVFLGSAAGVADGNPTTAHTQLESGQVLAEFGRSVAGAGDVNGDGYADVIVGAPDYLVGAIRGGAAFVFLGSAAGIADGNPATAHAQLESNQVNAEFGFSVAGAGDVNGDGYGDVLVGARGYGAGQAFEGAAFVFLGSAAGIADGNPATAQAQLESNQVSAQFGFSVAGAGDVNGDGYGDVLVGAPFYDEGQLDEGAAFVFLGSGMGIDSSAVHALLESNQADAGLGYSVAAAGDVNGDGYADVIVGAQFASAGQANEGIALVFLGSATGVANGSPSNANALLESDQASAFFGTSVAGAGDVNGDGYADVIVGAPDFDAGQTNEGAAFVFLGGATGITDSGPAAAYVQLESNLEGAWLGSSVAGAGDVNGDGYADVIVGAFGYGDFREIAAGAAFVFLGSAAGIADGDPTTARAVFESDQATALFGTSVSGAGDVNGDGYGDVIVGAPDFDAGEINEGAAFIFLGSAAGITGGNPTFADAQLESDQAFASFGRSVAAAGDVNGDGYGDVIIGANRYDAAETNGGAAFIFLGSAAGVADGDPTTAHAVLESDQASADFGGSVAGAGDVNGDGYGDVVVGASVYSNAGAAFVFLGSATGIADSSPAAADARLESTQGAGFFGTSVAGAGDVNGDGYGDIIIGADFYDAGETDEGAAFVFLGSAAGITDSGPATAHAQLESDQASAFFGASVAGAGDVNGDGYGDLIVGAPLYDAGEVNEGAAFVFLGHAFGIVGFDPPTAHAQLESNQAGVPIGASFGQSVAGAGDVNGDGFADVIVGAHHFDVSGTGDEGASFVFLGSATGIADGDSTTAHAWLESDQPGGFFGIKVAGAGDVNGDGFADLILGAPRYAAGETREGAAFLFLGNGNRNGYPILAQQLQGNAGSAPVPSWGRSLNEDTFQIALTATHPAGLGRVKLDCEICPPDVSFGHSSCMSHTSLDWVDVTTSRGSVRLTEAIGGLTPGTLYRWRARVLRAPFTGAVPIVPTHGPWRRLGAQSVEADIRVVPEPDTVVCLIAGALALCVLWRWGARDGRGDLQLAKTIDVGAARRASWHLIRR